MRKFLLPSAFIAFALTLLPAGCPQTGAAGGGTTTTTTNTLTSQQAEALATALSSIESLSTTVNTAGGAAGTDSQSGLDAPSTCPTFEFAASNTNGLALSVSADFGTGCTVAGTSDLTCAGAANGTLSTSNLTLAFDALNCNGNALNGDVSFAYSKTSTVISLNGTWDVQFQSDDVACTADGAGSASYDSTAKASTVSTFVGTLTKNADSYECSLDSVVVSYQSNGNFIPQSGQATLSSPAIDSLVIKFDANSPSTGDVQVSVNGSPFFTHNILN